MLYTNLFITDLRTYFGTRWLSGSLHRHCHHHDLRDPGALLGSFIQHLDFYDDCKGKAYTMNARNAKLVFAANVITKFYLHKMNGSGFLITSLVNLI